MVKSWLVQDQTVLGKDYSNLLIADSLLKTIWFINAPCYGNEALASPKANELTIPEQTATGKGTSNPFMAVFINQQLSDMSHHKKIYVNPSHTKKIFANMRREGKDFSGRVTPLFATMMVQANQEEGVDSGIPTDSHQTPITTQPLSSRSQKKQSRRKQRKDTAEETQQDNSVPTPSNDPPLS
ncbi:hypothetical protein Tco_1167497, partial [Tanacetum coccineum]